MIIAVPTRRRLSPFLILLLWQLSLKSFSQNIRLKTRYGEQLYYVQENMLKAKNRYGNSLLFYEDQSIKLKNR